MDERIAPMSHPSLIGAACASCLIFALACPLPAFAQIEFEGGELRQLSDTWYLTAQSRITLNKEILDFLAHGIPLHIRTRLRLRRQRSWLWDETMYVREVLRQLQYEPLSDRYVVIDARKFKRSSFRNLEQALVHLGRFENYPILQGAQLPTNGRYHATLHSGVNVESLPAAMRPVSWFSWAWDLESEEYRWELQP
ncbi:MAG: DUF4390 domain-containing protein [Candidatus Eutrophobiaceae bacterium]